MVPKWLLWVSFRELNNTLVNDTNNENKIISLSVILHYGRCCHLNQKKLQQNITGYRIFYGTRAMYD